MSTLKTQKQKAFTAFTLLEVMIATALFFMAIFSILGVVTRSLNAARNLQPLEVDPGSLASELSLTNRLEEGPIPDEMAMDFARLFPGYTCAGMVTEVATNGLFQVDLQVFGNKGKNAESKLSLLLFRIPINGPLRGPGARGVRR
jgi:Tfp pilus assembly protein PilV